MEFEDLKDVLLSTVDTGLKYAREVDNMADFELYLFYENRTKASINQGVVDASDGIVEGNAVRVAKENSVSFASSSGVSVERIKRSIDETTASLRSISIKDERFRNFCEPKRAGNEGTFAKEILALGKEDLIGFASNMVKEGQGFDKRIKTVGSECAAEWGGFAVGNTLGVQETSRSVMNSCEVFCIAIDGEERRTGYEFDITRENLIKPAGLGAKAAQKAVSLLGAQTLDQTTTLPTIWEPIAAAAFIYASLGQSARGEYVVEGRSPISDKIGKGIANPKFTIIDNGQKPSGINTDAIDAEGNPQQKTTIIEQGKLNKFLFDLYYANIYGTQTTGNCTRHSRPFGSTLPYETSPLIRPKNLEVKPGSKKLDDLIASIDGRAIYIVDIPIGIFHSDVSTGEFSAVAQSCFLVENGEKKSSLQPVSVSGNFYAGLQNLLDVGSDLEKTLLIVETPTLVFDGFSITG